MIGRALPADVRIREVGPRDGFQNEPETIATADKIRLIDALGGTGLRRIEVASFVRSDLIPQVSDAIDVLHGIQVPGDVSLMVLVPNERGLRTALEHRGRFHEVVVFVSASETHNRRNVNRAVEETMSALERMIPAVREAGLRCAAVVATAFGCPYEGAVDAGRVLDLAGRLARAGADEVGFGDTTGMGNPAQVADLFARALDALTPAEVTAHFHNTRGQGLANVLAALQSGVTSFESSFGEIGGCPLPPGATGNVATEDVVSMLHEMGVDTGVDLEALVGASAMLQDVLGRRLGSHVLVAGPVRWSADEGG